MAGGATAAARLRRLNEKAEIIVLRRAVMYPMPTAACPTTSAGSSKTKSIDSADACKF